MSGLFTPGRDSPRRAAVAGVWRAIVTRIDENGHPLLEIPRYTPGFEYGPIDVTGYVVGDRVLVGFLEGRPDDVAILGGGSGGGGGGGGGQDVIYHGDDPDVERPASAASSVVWIGSVEPVNATVEDLWYDTDATVADLIGHSHDLADLTFDVATQAELDAVDGAKVAKSGDTMTGPIVLPDGTVASPSLGFLDGTVGFFYRDPPGEIVAVNDGVESAYFRGGGFHPFVDAAKQLGASTRRWLEIHGIEMLFGDGSASDPAVKPESSPSTGLFYANGDVRYSKAGTEWGALRGPGLLWAEGSGSAASIDVPMPNGAPGHHVIVYLREVKGGSSGHSFYMRFIEAGVEVTTGYAYTMKIRYSDGTDYREDNAGNAAEIRLTGGQTARNDQRANLDLVMDSSQIPRGVMQGYTVNEAHKGVGYAAHAEYVTCGFQRDNVGTIDAIRLYSQTSITFSYQVYVVM